MILSSSGRTNLRWKIDTGDKIADTGNGMLLINACSYHGCVIYRDNSAIGVYGNGSDKGAACIDSSLKGKEACSECIFGKLGKNEYYKAERIKPEMPILGV